MFHLRFQLSTNTQRILNYHLFQVFNPALKLVKPSSSAFQSVGRADVENQKAIDILNQSFLIDIRSQQNRVLRLNSPVAAHVQIPAVFRSNDPKIFALSFRAFASAARDSRFELVGRSQTAIPQFNFDRQTRRILHPKTAPSATHTRFYSTQSLTVSVSRLKSRINQPTPNMRQLIHASSKQINPLPASNLSIKPKIPGNFSQNNQFIRRNFSTGHSRHHRISTVALNICQKVIVRILQTDVRLL